LRQSDASGPSRVCAAGKVAGFFRQHILQHRLVERQHYDLPFELGVLFLELLYAPDFTMRHTSEFGAAVVKRRIADAHLATYLRYRCTQLSLLRCVCNLLVGIPAFLHGMTSVVAVPESRRFSQL
jgi:hypothetical protein